jgi:tetratricopeptide (TPR) repeat protein/DNA-binding XRE family transcriptional regulator
MVTNYELAPFGDMLKTFRTRRHLTQQMLAQTLGVHRNSIVRWERGDFLPDSKAIILEMVRCLHLNDQEARQFLEASLSSLSPYWTVPLPRNLFFTGREAILETLHTRLGADHRVALSQSSALHGLGGIGKTQIALEYAYRYALEYSAVFWIGAETEEQITTSLLHIAEVLHLPEWNDKDQQRVIAAVQRWLSIRGQWLLIWDNVEDLRLLNRFLPPSRSGALLFTTRNQAPGTFARGLDLSQMEPDEGTLFFLRRAKILHPEATGEQIQLFAENKPAEYTAAQRLVTTLGGLPLAIDQAGAYIEETGCRVSDYLQRYEQLYTRLLERRGGSGGDHPQSVTTTFVLAMERLEQKQSRAADLLRTCAFLYTEAIPEEIFIEGTGHLEPLFEPMATTPSQFDESIAALRSLSLVQRYPETRTFSIHRLVQLVIRTQIDTQDQARYMRRVVTTLHAMFPEVAYDTWKLCERLLPHVVYIATFSPSGEDLILADLLRKAADYLCERAQYEQAEPLYQRSLSILEQVAAPAHPLKTHVYNGLAFLYYDQGKYEQAEALFQKALNNSEQTLGSGHLQMAHTLNGLGLLSLDRGLYEQARQFFERTLQIREQALGPEHIQVADTLNNLASPHLLRQEYAQAKPLYERAIHIYEQASGPISPRIAYPLTNLANLYVDQKLYEQAQLLYERALHIREQELGPKHPQVAYPLFNLAELYYEQEKYEQAEPLYKRALHIREQAFGQEYPGAAYPLNSLANLYVRQGKYKQAEPLYKRALHIREQHLGLQHPETAQTLHALAVFRQQQGKLDEAISLAERALQIRSQSLGDTHSETTASRTLYDQLMQERSSMSHPE